MTALDPNQGQAEHLRLEEAALTAWPALQQILYDGWLLRFADGYTKRANSVNALYPSTLDLDRKISRCEAAYAERNLPVIFRVTPHSQPDGLDERLEQRRYKVIDRTLVMSGALNSQAEEPTSAFGIRNVSLLEWLEGYARLCSPTVEQLALQRGIVTRIPTPLCLALGFQGGDPVGYVLGVLDSELVGIFGLYVAPTARGSGLGKAMLQWVLRWARLRGATKAYLQVEAKNDPAIRLYCGMGLAEAYPYWYRVQGNC